MKAELRMDFLSSWEYRIVRIPRTLPPSGYETDVVRPHGYKLSSTVHTADRLARELLCSRREDITLSLYMDNRHRFVGHAIVATGWVQTFRLSVHSIVAGAQASRATGCVIFRYRRYGLPSSTEAKQRSFRSIAGACWHHGLDMVDHLVVVSTDGFSSAFLGKPRPGFGQTEHPCRTISPCLYGIF